MAPRLPSEINAALALHEMLRRMGFAATEIFVKPHWPPLPLQVVIRAQGQEFVIDVGAMTLSPEAFVKRWQAAVAAFNTTLSEGEMRALLDGLGSLDLVALGTRLVQRGFVLPGLEAAQAFVQAQRDASAAQIGARRAQE